MTDDAELCQATLARGREVYRDWPGSAAEVAIGRLALNHLAGAVLFQQVDSAFTAALVAFARGLHAIAQAQPAAPGGDGEGGTAR